MRKDEAIERTFKGVAKHFRDVFAELVPGVWGDMWWGDYSVGGSSVEDFDWGKVAQGASSQL